uniref:Gustatory receptor n=1 Tax=Timema genevievae TaxID=629358 RepID=A0A7R9PKX0_TIMGE|nr:unnamed protein product [Timema genevievae]
MVTIGILLLGKIPMVPSGIEARTSRLVARSADHYTKRLVSSVESARLFSGPMLYSLVVYATMVTLLVMSIKHHFTDSHRNVLTFDFSLYIMWDLLFLVIGATLPIAMMFEATQFHALVCGWHQLQADYKRLTGRHLVLQLKRIPLMYFCLVLALDFISAAIDISEHGLKFHSTIFLAKKISMDCIAYCSVALWLGNCLAIISAGKIIITELYTELNFRPNKATCLSNYRKLWMQLSQLTRYTGTSRTYSIAITFLYFFVIVVMESYRIILVLYSSSTSELVIKCVNTFQSFLCIFLVCDLAHRATECVSTKFGEGLLKAGFMANKWSSNESMTIFYETITTSPPTISLRGCGMVNHRLFTWISLTCYSRVKTRLLKTGRSEFDPEYNNKINGNITTSVAAWSKVLLLQYTTLPMMGRLRFQY